MRSGYSVLLCASSGRASRRQEAPILQESVQPNVSIVLLTNRSIFLIYLIQKAGTLNAILKQAGLK